MRILFTVQPATGHLHPLIPVVQAAEEAGHEVAVCSSPLFAAKVAPFGFEFFGAGIDWLASDRTTWTEFPEMPPPPSPEFPGFVVTVFADITARAMAPDVIRIAEDWKPDVIVREMMEWGGYLAAERLGIPHASVGGNAYAGIDSPDVNYYPGNRRMVGECLGRHRAELNLPADPQLETPFRYLHMCFMPRLWDREDAPAPANTQYFRHTSIVRSEVPMPARIDELPDQPTVLAALGTVATPAHPPLLKAIADGLGGEPVNLILVSGGAHDQMDLGEVPSNVRVERYVPQAKVLKSCDLFITHGGFNSVKEALALGIPLVVVPIMSDQPYSAERCGALGVGRVLGHDDRSPHGVRDAVLSVLGEESPRSAAEALSREMMALPGPEGIADALFELAPDPARA